MTSVGPSADVQHFNAELWIPCGNKLGECPLWDPARRSMCWLDIQGRKFWRCHVVEPPEATRPEPETFELPVRAGSLCLTEDGEYVFAFEDGFSFYKPESAHRLRITEEFEPGLRTRLNDGRVDRQGRFVAGGNVEKGSEPESGVYRLNADLSVECLLQGVRCSNSIAFSADGRDMFFADTMAPEREIRRYPLYDEVGMQGIYEVFTQTDGKPDGSVLDTEGGLWNAEFGAGRVVRYAPDGSVSAIVHVPVPYTTCAGFGGADLQTLFITDASLSRLSKAKLEQFEPGHPGGLFRVRVPYRGLPDPFFKGSSESLMRG